MLTDQEIDALFDEHGWSPSTLYYPVVSAIEQAATAPLLAKIAELERILKIEERLSFRCQVAELEAEAIRLRGLLRDLVRTTAAHHQSPGDMPIQAAYVAARDAALEELRKDGP